MCFSSELVAELVHVLARLDDGLLRHSARTPPQRLQLRLEVLPLRLCLRRLCEQLLSEQLLDRRSVVQLGLHALHLRRTRLV